MVSERIAARASTSLLHHQHTPLHIATPHVHRPLHFPLTSYSLSVHQCSDTHLLAHLSRNSHHAFTSDSTHPHFYSHSGKTITTTPASPLAHLQSRSSLDPAMIRAC